MIDCLILDDRPDTCEKLTEHLRSFGLEAEVTSIPQIWWDTREAYSDAHDEVRPPLLIDNHLEDVPPFQLDGIQINFNRDNAGFNILELVIIPKIDSGELKGVPIALVSSYDIDSIRSEFIGRYGSKYDNIFFFSKNREEGKGSEESLKYISMVKTYLNSFQFEADNNDEALLVLLDLISGDLGFDEAQVRSIFNVTSTATGSINEILRRSETHSWKQKIVALGELNATLRSTFEEADDYKKEVQHWLRTTLLARGRTAMSALLAGDESAPRDALDKALFPYVYE